MQALNAPSLDALRRMHDEQFIRLAYRCLMGFEVDAEGMDHWRRHLRTNIDAAEFLRVLSESRTSTPSAGVSVATVGAESILGSRIVLGDEPVGALFASLKDKIESSAEAALFRATRSGSESMTASHV